MARTRRRHIPAPPVGEEVNNLPVQVAFTVPSTRGDEEIDQQHFQDRVEFAKKWFDRHFGGDTSIRGKGGYLMGDELIEEPVVIVESSMSIDTYKEKMDDFAYFIKERRENWKQDSVFYRVEDRAFIYPQRDYIDDDVTIPEALIRVI